MSVRTEPRFTRDADFAVAFAGDAEAEAVIQRLRASSYEIAAVVNRKPSDGWRRSGWLSPVTPRARRNRAIVNDKKGPDLM